MGIRNLGPNRLPETNVALTRPYWELGRLFGDLRRRRGRDKRRAFLKPRGGHRRRPLSGKAQDCSSDR